MSDSSIDRIGELLKDDALMERAFRAAWRDVCIRHKSGGVPIVVVRDGVVVHIPPEEIVIEEIPAGSPMKSERPEAD
ncbi:MAG: hypothetical protein SF069_13195 [Phycisphaerae bacterium]|nr:hypothetical protein [Phycisphaerae bacterium]